MVKSTNLHARTEPDTKEQTEVILQRGLPFELKMPSHPLNMSQMTAHQFDAEIEKGLYSLHVGEVEPTSKVFADLRKEIQK